ncbi:MAG TPA: hypothetical protein VE173_10345 [Longimicrobiales bacterium]|nr:hypothetical protein [Longimicrobiales bacterium]
MRNRGGGGQYHRRLGAPTAPHPYSRLHPDDSAPLADHLRARYLSPMEPNAKGGTPAVGPDPVIEAYKKDIDRSLLRENLRKTP